MRVRIATWFPIWVGWALVPRLHAVAAAEEPTLAREVFMARVHAELEKTIHEVGKKTPKEKWPGDLPKRIELLKSRWVEPMAVLEDRQLTPQLLANYLRGCMYIWEPPFETESLEVMDKKTSAHVATAKKSILELKSRGISLAALGQSADSVLKDIEIRVLKYMASFDNLAIAKDRMEEKDLEELRTRPAEAQRRIRESIVADFRKGFSEYLHSNLDAFTLLFMAGIYGPTFQAIGEKKIPETALRLCKKYIENTQRTPLGVTFMDPSFDGQFLSSIAVSALIDENPQPGKLVKVITLDQAAQDYIHIPNDPALWAPAEGKK